MSVEQTMFHVEHLHNANTALLDLSRAVFCVFTKMLSVSASQGVLGLYSLGIVQFPSVNVQICRTALIPTGYFYKH